METGKTILATSAGTPARLTLITSSSPSPSPVRLSPVCSTEPSGLRRLLKNTKCWSDSTLPWSLVSRALASRSKSVPVVVRASQPRPTTTAVRFGASLVSETLPPLLRLTPTCPPVLGAYRSSPDQRPELSDRFPWPALLRAPLRSHEGRGRRAGR